MVLAYQYTTITSVMILDCFSIPVVMFLSFFVFRRRYRILHFVGVLVCLIGLAALLISDISYASFVDGEFVLFGDLLCLVGATLYGLSNVGQELALRHAASVDTRTPTFLTSQQHRSELLGMMGLFAAIISFVQAAIFEASSLYAFVTHNGLSHGLWLLVWVVLFGLCLFSLYMFTPLLLIQTSAVFLNLSLLTSDGFSVLAAVLIFHQSLNAWYFVSLVFSVTGIVVYSIPKESTAPSSSPLPLATPSPVSPQG